MIYLKENYQGKTYTIGPRLNGGDFAAIYEDLTNPDIVIKVEKIGLRRPEDFASEVLIHLKAAATSRFIADI